MRWLSANWIWLVVVGGMLWMHLGMHRGHGGHGGHGGHSGHGRSTRPQEQGSSTGHDTHAQPSTAEPDAEPGTAEVGAAGHRRHRSC